MRVAGHIVKLLVAFSLFFAGCVKYAPNQPSIINEDVQTVYAASAITHCSLSGIDGTSPVTKFGQCWSSANDVPDYIINQGKTEFTDNKNGDYASRLTGLFPKTTYYIRAYYIAGSDTIYAKQITFFTTKDTATSQPPNVATLAAFGVSTGSFYITGSVVSIGSSNVISYGHCYSSTNTTPTIADTKTDFGALSAAKQYSSLFTSLTPHTTYYVRAYATNDVGTSYGNTVTVTTTANGPTINVIDPTSGQAGTIVTITGTNFDSTAAKDTVRFNGTLATVVSATATQIVVMAPANGTTGNVTVTTAGGTSNGVVFTYTIGPDIYLAGENASGGLPGYWKNNTFTSLTNCGAAFSIFVSGTDVYVCGVDIATLLPVYWKNGVESTLSVTAGVTQGQARSIVISGTDIYIAGYEGPFASSAPKLWINGISQTLTTPVTGGSQGAYAVAVSGSDVYVAGNSQISLSGAHQNATIWKNGTPTYLTNGDYYFLSSVFINGSDIYAAGQNVITSFSNPRYYWKNNTALTLSGTAYRCTGIGATTAGDVYISGDDGIGPQYWINGTVTPLLPNPINASYATGLFVVGNDVYICGNYGSGTSGYWKNGTWNAVTNAQSINAIFVK